MKTLVLNSQDLETLKDSSALNVAMKDSLMQLSAGRAKNYNRHVVDISENAAMGFMPSTYLKGNLIGFKAVSVFAENKKQGLNPHQGFVVLLNSENGTVRAILDGSTITALRTAAVSAVATEKLSRIDSSTLAIIGAGRQALEHALAISKIRPIKRIIFFNRTESNAEKLAQKYFKNFEVVVTSSPKRAVQDADIVVTCTSSQNPLFSTDDLRPGTHVNTIGACRPGFREIEFKDRSELKIYLDSTAACMSEASELIQPMAIGQLSSVFIRGELGDCLNSNVLGRFHGSEITVFKSVGLGIQDLFAANYFFREAQKKGLGAQISFGAHNE